eukprot:TRINITY_DN1494_c0_g1_i4.p1 TRINITY_DN1494_c0_g1~~TRINITY_DN1494_c0_g1_i4.p1  ORF type:complete len:308 (-),score=27.89 TRINITY_DN1494_c0_g1_i4:192-1115(-)
MLRFPQIGRILCSVGANSAKNGPKLPDGPELRHFLTDTFRRTHNYLRISLTERCNLRCTYCMPEEGVPLTPKRELLTSGEILRLAGIFARGGVTKVRLTGGEPTVRPDLPQLVRGIRNASPNIDSVTLTTNGIALTLGTRLDALLAAGLTGVNISLDTLVEAKFRFVTRRKGMARVLRAVEECAGRGGLETKVNVVLMRDFNLDEVSDFVRLAKRLPVTVRFIEYMPFSGNNFSEKRLVKYTEVLPGLVKEFGIAKVGDGPNDTTKHYSGPDFLGKIGFITSMSDHFCGSCNRVRRNFIINFGVFCG